MNFSAARRPPAPLLRLAAIVITAAMLAPVAAVALNALAGDSRNGLSAAAIADYLGQTVWYAGGTIMLALLIALPAAWLTVMRRIPGHHFISWALLMPLALPPYIIGYAYSHFFSQTLDISLRGGTAAAVVTALAVYPYIYLFARAALRQQSRHIQNAARLMGYSPLAAGYLISWPLARPAVIAGTALALMETLNDIAIAEHYGVRALGLGVYDLWLNRGDSAAACRLAVLLMLAVLAALAMEAYGRRRQRHYAAQCDRRFACDHLPPLSTTGDRWCALLLLLPAVGGFFLPVLWFAKLTIEAPAHLWRSSFWEGLSGSLILSSSAAALLLVLAALLLSDKRHNRHGVFMAPAARFSQAGYALPGAVLAQGFFILSAASGRSLLAAGLPLVIAACAARFLMFMSSALETGMNKISPQLDQAARLAKVSTFGLWRQVHLPLLRPAAAAGALAVFLETVKELPITLILRPFDFQTLATVIYQYAADESLELAGPAVLVIATIGTFAVSVLFLLEGRKQHSPP